MADWLEAFVPLRTHVLVRFGRWDDLVAQPLPEDRELYCSTTAMVLYGRGVAYAALGDVAAARRLATSSPTRWRQVPDTRYLFNNTARDILAIAEAMLDGEIAYRQGTHRGGLRPPSTGDRPRRRPARTTSHGAGCSRPDTHTARSCSSRAGSRTPRRCMRRTSGSTRR